MKEYLIVYGRFISSTETFFANEVIQAKNKKEVYNKAKQRNYTPVINIICLEEEDNIL